MKFTRSIKRFLFVIFFLSILWISGFFLIQSFRENMEYYFTPTQIHDKYNDDLISKKKLRIGGLVVTGSIKKNSEGTNFIITDLDNQINVLYKGSIFPPIFRENVGVIARGYLVDENIFIAEQLIGKHDENYMPKSEYKK